MGICTTLSAIHLTGTHVPATEMERKTATVLCIDDERIALQIRQELLESAGYRVVAAKSGAQGIQAFKSEPIHAVVLDYWCPSGEPA